MSNNKPVALLLSAYRADSHAAWADWLVGAMDEFEWRRFELPGRHFSWRIRGNPLSWLDALPATPPDIIVATSMVDLATIKGIFPNLVGVPALYYFHENQFAYPRSDRQHSSVDPQMVQIYGALSANRVLFNSAFNRDSFLAGVGDLMAKMPDLVPEGLVSRLAGKSGVCAVPVRRAASGASRQQGLLLWNHRWEYDKAPELFSEAMCKLARRGVEFRLALLGARPDRAPEALRRLRDCLGDRIVEDRKVDRETYRRILASASIVVSTARHEFQGLAMMEAVAAGACPLAPDDLCYREQYPAMNRYPAGNLDALVSRLAGWLREGLPTVPDTDAWCEKRLAPRWREHLHRLRTTN